MKKSGLIIISIIGLTLLTRLFQIEKIPGEWFGDISIVSEYVSRILALKWPLYFEAGVGPFYQYLISPIIFFIGGGFLGLKIASVTVSTAGIIGLYFLGRELFSIPVAFIACLFGAVYFSDLAWSRIGVSSIVFPLMTVIIIYSALKFAQNNSKLFLIIGSLVSSLGLLTYPGAFIYPLLFLILVIC